VIRPGPVTCVAALVFPAALAFAGYALAGDARPYELPAAGSYELPVIDRLSPHQLLDSTGEPAAVLDLSSGQCEVVSFTYGGCPDAKGCPLILSSLRRLDQALAEREELSGRVRLVSVSFDPERDTPEQMAMLRSHMKPRGDWRFLTAPSEQELTQVLDDFGQNTVPLTNADGVPLGIFRHVTKVFLVDDQGAVRNIYSSDFLDAEILLRDIETLLLAPDFRSASAPD